MEEALAVAEEGARGVESLRLGDLLVVVVADDFEEALELRGLQLVLDVLEEGLHFEAALLEVGGLGAREGGVHEACGGAGETGELGTEGVPEEEAPALLAGRERSLHKLE